MTAAYWRYGLCLGVMIAASYGQSAPQSVALHVAHNPLVSDGSTYSADPAPVVDGDTLYIVAGRDEAAPGVNDFIMNEWQLFATKDPASGNWQHYPHFLRPEQVFKWAAPGRAYGAQIIQGPDKKYYFYAPVMQAHCSDKDCMAIGVAVADHITGPWRDAHPSGPIISQLVPQSNDLQNIDPTPFVDDSGKVYIYWGTFGKLRAMELASDMITPKSDEVRIEGLTGFFEAPWLFKRNGTYYLVYADNDANPEHGCTPAFYHACLAYGTASSPLGPWTYRGVILPPVSSTTSHSGVVAFKNKWYLAYHTADAKDGGHFRRSVALDELQWDDSAVPAAIKKVIATPRPATTLPAQRNIAPAAKAFASNEPIPAQYWIKALNDGVVQQNPLPPDMWGTWVGNNPPQPWIAYLWSQPVTFNRTRIYFWNDQPAGAGVGVAPPKTWHLEYCNGKDWLPVKATTPYATDTGRWVTVDFEPVSARCMRAVFDASSSGGSTAGVAVQEWEVWADKPMSVSLGDQ